MKKKREKKHCLLNNTYSLWERRGLKHSQSSQNQSRCTDGGYGAKKKMANISVVGCLHMLINVFLYQDICSMRVCVREKKRPGVHMCKRAIL